MGFDFKGMMDKMADTRYARVRHILVEEKGEEGRSKLEAAKEEIAGDLDNFSEVAEAMSTCTSAVSPAPPLFFCWLHWITSVRPVSSPLFRCISPDPRLCVHVV